MIPPFIKDSKWPVSREPEERVANPGHDTQLEDHLMDEILISLESNDLPKFKEAIVALVHHIRGQNGEAV